MNNHPISILIFGASGDLTQRKLIPALYNLYQKKRLPEIQIIGTSRSELSHQQFREHLLEGVQKFSPDSYQKTSWDEFSRNIFYQPGNLTNLEDYQKLVETLSSLETGPTNRLYYLAISPEFYHKTVINLGESGLASQDLGEDAPWRHVIIEKPYGRDLQTARELNAKIHEVFSEDQVYRIDHYLGKETAQNILFFRFANTIFEPVWDRRYIDNVQITVAESVDVGHRAGYYDKAGILRDMFQNHLLQLLSLVAMEAPASFDADAIRNERVKLLRSIRPLKREDSVAGQYIGYCSAKGVVEYSRTPTYAALKLYIDNWRWKGVPFYLRSGKSLKHKATEITIEFQRPPHLMFGLSNLEEITPNILSICIEPDEGIHLKFQAKEPDSEQNMRPVDMEFHYQRFFESTKLPDAYERLLREAIAGDPSLFTRNDGIETAWSIFDPLIQSWEDQTTDELAVYDPGSWGPIEADELLSRDGHCWRMNCGLHEGCIEEIPQTK
ncbi:MAG: glucose-6-phosphate dehydrogenase [Anaerolineales bacterium]|nr:glucose-6-phosphate dehydrogenase [Anaerolineales bacterium]